MPLTANIGFKLVFGINAQGAFFISLPTGIDVQADIDSSGLKMPANVGLLAVQTEDANVRLNARTTISIKDINKDGVLTSNELTAANATLSQRGSLQAELPFQSQIGTRTESGVVSISHDDLSDSKANVVTLKGPSEISQLAQVNAFSVLQYLQDLGGFLDQAASSAADGRFVAVHVEFKVERSRRPRHHDSHPSDQPHRQSRRHAEFPLGPRADQQARVGHGLDVRPQV